jgi:transcriptional regulator with XRE-family HTH domain
VRVTKFAEYEARIPVRFPPTQWAQAQTEHLIHSGFENPAHPTSQFPRPFSRFEIVAPLHAARAAEWPLPVDMALAVRGFRISCGLSQAAFAQRIKQSRVTVERWEGGGSRPFRGRVHELLTALKPLVHDQISAGQFLGIASAAVLPQLTRPAGTYLRSSLTQMLRIEGHDHRAIGPALLDALVSAEVLSEVDAWDDSPSARFIATAALGVVDRDEGPWDRQARQVLAQLSDEDAQLWLQLGRRLSAQKMAQPA